MWISLILRLRRVCIQEWQALFLNCPLCQCNSPKHEYGYLATLKYGQGMLLSRFIIGNPKSVKPDIWWKEESYGCNIHLLEVHYFYLSKLHYMQYNVVPSRLFLRDCLWYLLGVKPVPNLWDKWKLDKLEPPDMRKDEKIKKDASKGTHDPVYSS